MMNCEDCSFSLSESVQPTNLLFRTTFRPAEMLHSFATMTLSAYQAKGPDSDFLPGRISALTRLLPEPPERLSSEFPGIHLLKRIESQGT